MTSQASTSDGPAGTIKVIAPHGDILLTDQASLFNNSFNAGPIGGIEIKAKSLLLDGGSTIGGNNLTVLTPGNITVTLSGKLNLDGKSAIHAIANGPADAAALTIRAQNIQLLTGDSLLTTETQSRGDGGALNLATEALQLTNGGQLRSNSVEGIDFVTGETYPRRWRNDYDPRPDRHRSISPDRWIRKRHHHKHRRYWRGRCGRSVCAIPHHSEWRSHFSLDVAGIVPNATGGSIIVDTTDHVTITNGASISAATIGPGNAGNVTISSDSLTIARSGGRIEASTSGAGDGGSIGITTTGDGRGYWSKRRRPGSERHLR